ncbi:MAG: DUF262 domain-containing protein [Candidatus Methanomethylophilaceae archaeon]|nr:DUF262 domain-containing protein [Candidatus Methanomethylophilaceae archaeon]
MGYRKTYGYKAFDYCLIFPYDCLVVILNRVIIMAGKRYGTVNRPISDMLNEIHLGRLGLPDLQRPFVWNNTKVRDLFDSLLKGYPVGFFMTWQFPDDYEDVRQIGLNKKNYEKPTSVVIDGQQRLTALLSVIYGIEVFDDDYISRRIMISYNPSNREFEVRSSATEKDPRFVPDISEAFKSAMEQKFVSFRRRYIDRLNESRLSKGLPELNDKEIGEIEGGLQDLISILNLELPTIDISRGVDSKEVANIFVRINSAGENLKQNDFILTLISVYDLEMKSRMDSFCADCIIPADGTSYNRLIEAKPSHIVKVVSGLAFERGRLRYVYKRMAGKLGDKDEEGMTEEEIRVRSFQRFSDALDKVLDLNTWHSFLNSIGGAGYVDKSFVAAENTIVYNYMLYLIGKHRYRVPVATLNAAIRRWYFVSSITAFYSGSTESTVERQLNDLKEIDSPDGFLAYLDKTMKSLFTEDYFDITLPMNFNSSSASGPYWFGFVASLVVLDVRALFSTISLGSLFLAGSSGTKNAYDKHHLFPKNYLTSIGFDNDRERNQFANFTYVDYPTNIDISDDPPQEYVPPRRKLMGEEEYIKMCEAHALPLNWENMEYNEFLTERRKLMADVVKKAYQKLGTLSS